MKILFLDLSMGAAGDMFAAALYELIDDKEEFINEINAAGIPKVRAAAQPCVKCGIAGTRMRVSVDGAFEHSEDAGHSHCYAHSGEDASGHSHPHEHMHLEEPSGHTHTHEHMHFAGDASGHCHVHRCLADIDAIIDGLNVSAKVKNDAKAIYKIIAGAESRAHGMEVSEIHFHEVGSMDAVADITMACVLMERLSPDKVISSPVCTGYGHVHASHGIIPVPAPATAYILEDIPSYEGEIEAELCTPTGAALIKYFTDEFARMPVLSGKKTGYGMGEKDFERCNALRAVIGKPYENSIRSQDEFCRAKFSNGQEEEGLPEETDKITEFLLTVDDMTGEETAFACERLFEAGALDVYVRPVYMKKNRPGFLIGILAKEADQDKIIKTAFRHTTTLGIRQALCERYILKREEKIVETEFGPVRMKTSHGYGAKKEKPEYEDIAEIARNKAQSLFETKERLKG